MTKCAKRIFFALLWVGVTLRLFAPLWEISSHSFSGRLLFSPVSPWLSLVVGTIVSYGFSFFLNFTDFVRYVWPLSAILSVLSRRVTVFAAIRRNGRDRRVSPSTLARSAAIIATVAMSVIGLVTLYAASFSPLSGIYILLSCFSFMLGVFIGVFVDIFIPRTSLSRLRHRSIPLVPRIPLSRYPMRWNKVAGPTKSTDLSYAVIIPCHNYGAFLREALQSVLSQTLPPSEVVVVLDSCTDNSEQVAAEFETSGVRIVRVNCSDPYLARRAGFYATKASLICCLDADDYVDESYFASGVQCFSDPDVGIATGWVKHFGLSSLSWEPLPGDMEQVVCVSSAGIFRRVAAVGTCAFEKMEFAGVFEEDYLFWKEISRAGWKVAVFDGTHFHRRHIHNRSITTPTEVEWVIGLRSVVSDNTRIVRVGYVASLLAPAGGVETLMNQLQRHAFRIEWSGVAHAPQDPEQLTSESAYMGIPVLESRNFEVAVRQLASISDVLYVWQESDLCRLAELNLDIPIWVCVHGQSAYSRRAASHIKSISSAHGIAVSEAARALCPPDTEVIYNGADLTALSQGPSRWQQRAMWGVKEDEIAVGYLGRWSSEKRVSRMLAAFTHLPAHIRPVLCIAGPLPDDSERKELEEIAGREIVWTTTNTPGAAYRALDAVVITSESEGGPLVALEAWACGCPLITTPVGMIPELFDSFGELAQLLPLHPTGLDVAQAIVGVLSDKSVTIKRRTLAKDVVWSHFSVWRTARAWERGLAQLANRGRDKQQALGKAPMLTTA